MSNTFRTIEDYKREVDELTKLAKRHGWNGDATTNALKEDAENKLSTLDSEASIKQAMEEGYFAGQNTETRRREIRHHQRDTVNGMYRGLRRSLIGVLRSHLAGDKAEALEDVWRKHGDDAATDFLLAPDRPDETGTYLKVGTCLQMIPGGGSERQRRHVLDCVRSWDWVRTQDGHVHAEDMETARGMLERRLCDGSEMTDDPAPQELQEVEARKAKIKAENLSRMQKY